MAASYFFYDLETSGFSPREARIMQFAGQRTDMDFQPIGEPVNVLIKLTPDVLPDPGAIMITGITPQQTIADGLTEAEFLHYFYKEVVTPDTTFLGFNSIRFDDEFMRALHYRNFYDPYEWHWANGCSRWDMLDVVRATRALRPDGIEWPFTEDGKPTNRLELLTKSNKLDHYKAHDALSDVYATIAIAKLIHDKQPGLFDFLHATCKKDKVKAVVDSGKPFMYTSGRYSSEFQHTTAAVLLGRHAEQDYALVYDLRVDPTPFLAMNIDQLIEAWAYTKDPDKVRLPVKTLKYNRCPAVVPGVVKDDATLERLKLSRQTVSANLVLLTKQAKPFVDKLFQAVKKMDETREASQLTVEHSDLTVDGRMYDGFFDNADKNTMLAVRVADSSELSDFTNRFHDARLKQLLPLYKARNYPSKLSSEERAAWDDFLARKLLAGDNSSRLTTYFRQLGEVSQSKTLTDNQRFLLEELQLYGESIVPADPA